MTYALIIVQLRVSHEELTFAPSLASAKAIDFPIPLDEPVTRHTFDSVPSVCEKWGPLNQLAKRTVCTQMTWLHSFVYAIEHI